MGFAISYNTILLVLVVAIVFMPQGTVAFGAGNIPSLATIEGSNFRHGDIEDSLAVLAMATGSFLSRLTGGKKFDNLAIKRVYFGNWLRDYSQAIDVGTLSKNISPELIRIILWILAFTEFGYATGEFEVTKDKLGVYRAEEHIDNPKGYAEGEDARTYDSRLRGPVDERELEIDRNTGMKNYICNESGGWPTSSEYVRTSLEKCIRKGRAARSGGGDDADEYEAFRLLGQALHTLEDFSAHSNYIELVLISLGYTDVFPHVGSNCKVHVRGQEVIPLVTGTFGGMDFIHSLLGGAQDSLSQIELAEVQAQLQNGSTSSADTLSQLFSQVAGDVDFSDLVNESVPSSSNSRSLNYDYSESREHRSIADELQILQDNAAGATDDPEELIAKIYPLFQFRDGVMMKIEKFLDAVPLLSSIKEKIADTFTIFIMGVIQPIITPILNDLVNTLHSGTEMIVNDEEQFRVWNDPNYDNPTHSQLSKDHFSNRLNEPAGKVAVSILAHIVPMVVKAWDDEDKDVDTIIEEALQVFHHPDFASTDLQLKMKETVEDWINNVENKDIVLNGLTSQGVRNGDNLSRKGNQSNNSNSGHQHGDGCGHDIGFKIPQSEDDLSSGMGNMSLGGNSSYNRPGSSSNQDDYGTGRGESDQYGRSDYNQYESERPNSHASQYGGRTSSNQYGDNSYDNDRPQYGDRPYSGRNDYYSERPGSSGYESHNRYGNESNRSEYASHGDSYGDNDYGRRSENRFNSSSERYNADNDEYSSGNRYGGEGYGSSGNYSGNPDQRRYGEPGEYGRGRPDYGDSEPGYGGRSHYGGNDNEENDNEFGGYGRRGPSNQGYYGSQGRYGEGDNYDQSRY